MSRRKQDRRGPLHLFVLGSSPDQEPVAIRRSPPHLPADVVRLPGETVEQLVHRAKTLAVGQGACFAMLVYRDEVRH